MVNPAASAGVHPFDWVDDIIFMLDAETRFTFVNAYALNAWNTHPHELLGRTFADVLPVQAAAEPIAAAFQQVLMSRQRTEVETFSVGQQAWLNITVYPHEAGLIVQVKRLLRNSRSTGPADHDALTGCLTRAAFQTRMQTVALPAALAIVDLNQLKSVNSLRGHSGGDAHIRAVAHTLRAALPPAAFICRWGGDEFVIVVPGHHRDTLQELLDATNHTAPGPLPDTAAFTGGLADWAQGTPFERAFAAADEQLQLRKEQLREVVAPWEHEADTFVAFSRELEGLREPGDLIQHTLNRLLRVMDFDQAAYAILEEDQLVYVHEAHRDGVPAPEPGLHVPVPLAGTAFQRVQRTRTTEWSTDYPSTPGALPQVVEQGVKSGMVTPVLRQGHVMATIVLCTVNRWQTITPHMRKTVELTVLRLEHALELRRAVGEVRSTLEAGMRTLSRVLEARDAETQGHTARAARLATRLGAHFRLDRTALEHLRYGAYLHDIGKLCIPERILKKPGKLTPEERATMQRHATEGHDLVTRLPGVAPQIVAVIRSHHERWDGRGYPDGLAGTDIPLGARIFSVCDVYDALISERPYKRAWSHDDAVLEIERQAGGQFDPEVVRAFLALVRDP